MNEFLKAIGTLHRILILATGAIFAFALSADPSRDLVAARDALSIVQSLDTAGYARHVFVEYEKTGSLTEPQTRPVVPHRTLMAQYTQCLAKPSASGEERTFALMEALAKTATVELAYVREDVVTTNTFAPSEPFAVPAMGPQLSLEPFSAYLPAKSDLRGPTILALQRNLGLIGDKTVERALETLRAEIDIKVRYPSVYGSRSAPRTPRGVCP